MQQPTLLDMGEMKDCQFMTAEEKRKVLKQWQAFLKSGLQKDKFGKSLYRHLTLHCEFIAHYDIHGFYSTYFEEGEDTARFLSQFDNSNGVPNSIEYGMIYWYLDGDYNDINSEMCRVATKYIPALRAKSQSSQRQTDIRRAEALLAKHGIRLNID